MLYRYRKLLLQSDQKLYREDGIALILTIIILSNLLIITLIVSDVVLRIGKSSQQISESEIAYYAAESSVEEAMYKIVKDKDASSLGTLSSPISGNLEDVDGNWERYVEPIYETLVTCVDNDNKITYHQVNSFNELINDPEVALLIATNSGSCIYAENFSDYLIRDDNQLVVLLAPGKSFELDLDTAVSDDNFYPNNLYLKWSKAFIPFKQSGSDVVEGKIVIFDGANQSEIDTFHDSQPPQGVKIPTTGDFGVSPTYRIRVINNETSDYGLYQFEPQGGTSNEYLPVAIKIKSKGYYSNAKKKERKVEVEKRNWQIY